MTKRSGRRSPTRSSRRRKAKPSAPPMRTAVLYARVSSREQEREGFSIPAQRTLLTRYAADNGLHISEEFVDVETAKATGRLAFDRMVAFLRQRRASLPVVLVEKTDRLYRNLKDWVTLDEMQGLEVHLVKEGIVLSADSRSSEKFVHGIKVLMAKNYVDNLSEEVQKGMRQKAQEGYWPSSAPIGYVNQRVDGRSRLAIDTERAALIRQLFVLYDAGTHSVKDLTRWALDNGLRGKRGGKIQASTIHHVLRNPIYAGEFYWAGKLYRGQDPVLITRELWERVQDRLDGHPYTRGTERRFAYTGLITCGHCGAAVTAEIKKERYIYYHCAQRCTKEPFVREVRLHELFAEIVRPLKLPDHLREIFIKALRDSRRDIAAETAESLAAARERVDRFTTLIDRAYEDKLEGKIDAAFFHRKRAEWEEQRAVAMREIERLTHASTKSLDMAVQVFELANQAYDLFIEEEPQERRALLEVLLSNCDMAGGVLTPTYRKPFNLLVELAKSTTENGPPPGDSEGGRPIWSG
jgi:site-specific DNA recombinase